MLVTDSSSTQGASTPAQTASEFTYVLVPGAWQPASAWDQVAEQLRAHGHQVVIVELPGQGLDTTPLAEVTLASHVATVTHAVEAQPGRVILVGHSYGGVVISQVGEDCSAKIQELVYVAAFLPAKGESLLTWATQNPDSVVSQHMIVNGPATYVPTAYQVDAFYNTSLSSTDPQMEAEVAAMLPLLRPQALATLTEPVRLTQRYERLAKTYIMTTKDHTIAPAVQRRMYNRWPEMKVVVLQSDHTPLLTATNQLTALLEDVAAGKAPYNEQR